MATNVPVRLKTISEYHAHTGLAAPEHPLLSVINFDDMPADRRTSESRIFEFYSIAIKRGLSGKLKYGQQTYDFNGGVMFFIAPNQVFSIDPKGIPLQKLSGWMLLVHPDFFWNTPMAKRIRQYEFFDYSVYEALFLSEKEEAVINQLMQGIQQEYRSSIDKFSQSIIISQIETLLNYSDRFYQRQFITRKISNHQTLVRLEELLEAHFSDPLQAATGIPSVQSVADALNVSPGYLGSLLKTLTGQSTQQHIHNKLIEKAKEKLSTTALSVSEIAYELGFEHSQSFSKLFKSKTQQSPLEFRARFG